MLSVVMYGILSNVCFTMGFVLPEQLPVYYLPKELLRDFLVAFALALGVNIFFLPLTSRTIFFVHTFQSLLNGGFFYQVYSCHRGSSEGPRHLSHSPRQLPLHGTRGSPTKGERRLSLRICEVDHRQIRRETRNCVRRTLRRRYFAIIQVGAEDHLACPWCRNRGGDH